MTGRIAGAGVPLLLAALSLSGCGAASGGADDVGNRVAAPGSFEEFVSAADEFLAGAVGGRHPGVAAAFLDSEGSIRVLAHGVADRETQAPVSGDSIFQVASISKTLTAYGVMGLVDDGLVRLDAPVGEYLTRYRLPDSRHDPTGVTVRRVLSHTAGLSLSGYPGFPPDRPLPTLERSLAGETGRFYGLVSPGAVRLKDEPGDRFKYSGGGYTILQLLIEEVTGREFAGYMAEAVLQPLGMTSSTFDPAGVDAARLAVGHNKRGKPVPNYLFTAQAAAGLYSTAGDLALLLRDLAESGDLCSACVSELERYSGPVETNGIARGGGSGAADGAAADAVQAGQGDGPGSAPPSPEPDVLLSAEAYGAMLSPVAEIDDGVYMGLGFRLRITGDGSFIAYHYGGNQGWQSYYGINMDTGEGIVILTNSDRGIDDLIDPVLAIYDRYLNREG